MKNEKIKQNIEPWWFWGCDKKSYFSSFNGGIMTAVILEEDTRANRDAWEAIENGRIPERP